jgi:integrase
MQRKVDNKERGATRKEGIMSTSTRDRYRVTIRDFTNFLDDKNTPLADITPATIAKYKVVRHKAVVAKNNLVAVLAWPWISRFSTACSRLPWFKRWCSNSLFRWLVKSKPGENPKNGAHAFTGEELASIRQATVHKNSRKQTIDDMHVFLLLRWCGLRVSDAVRLQWKHVHFDRGSNGEIEILT